MKDWAALIQFIQFGKSVDVGLVIQNSIIHGATFLSTSIYHPLLITMLCKNAGILWTTDEEVQQPKRIIGNNLIRNMKDESSEAAGANYKP